MNQDEKNQRQKEGDNKPAEFSDEATKNKISRHLTDPNDTISEEDIKNIKSDITSAELSMEEKESKKDQSETNKKEVNKNKDKDDEGKDDTDKKEPLNPWDVLV